MILRFIGFVLIVFLSLSSYAAKAHFFTYVGMQGGFAVGETKMILGSSDIRSGGKNMFGVQGGCGGAIAGFAFADKEIPLLYGLEFLWSVSNAKYHDDQTYGNDRSRYYVKQSRGFGGDVLIGYPIRGSVVFLKAGVRSSQWCGKVDYPGYTGSDERQVFLDNFLTGLSAGIGLQGRLGKGVSARITFECTRYQKKSGTDIARIKIRPILQSVQFALIFHPTL